MMLHHAGVKYEDIRLTEAEFDMMKKTGKLDFGSLPMFEIEGMAMTQT